MPHQPGHQLQEARGLRSGVGAEQFLCLIHRQHHGGGGLPGSHIQHLGAGYLRASSNQPCNCSTCSGWQAFLIAPSSG